MSEILVLNTIDDYNSFLGVETLHPLVSMTDFSKIKSIPHRRKRFEFYTIFYKTKLCGDITYGRNKYDYQEGTLLFVAPSQVAGVDDGGETPEPCGYALMFHPDLLRNTPLAHKMKEYTFFSYESNEALHRPARETEIIRGCFLGIEAELQHNIDNPSKAIIAANIEVLLNHCLRFYDRQFVTRKVINKDVLIRFENLLSNYFESGKAQQTGLPTVAYCADQLHFSPNYFGDLIKKETGKSAIEYIHLAIIEKVKDQLAETNKTISEIAYETGFQYPHHLSRMFKKVTGCNPNEYRAQNAFQESV